MSQTYHDHYAGIYGQTEDGALHPMVLERDIEPLPPLPGTPPRLYSMGDHSSVLTGPSSSSGAASSHERPPDLVQPDPPLAPSELEIPSPQTPPGLLLAHAISSESVLDGSPSSDSDTD